MSEQDRLKQRFSESGVVGFHASWGPDAANMSPEERAGILNSVMDECDHPVRGLAANLAGEAFLYEDKAMSLRHRHKIEDGRLQPVSASKAEEAEAKRAERMAELFNKAAIMLRKLQDEKDARATQGERG